MTLIELLVAIAVLAVLVAAGAPFFGDMIVNARLREAGNVLLAETLMAQSEAVKRNGTVRVSTNASTVQVIDVTVPAAPVVLRTRTLVQSVAAPAATFDFSSDGRPTPFGTAVALNLSLSGALCSSDVRCPGLRVEAGGAVRLCGNHLEASC